MVTGKTNGFHFKFKGSEFMPQTLIFNHFIFSTHCRRPLKDMGIRICNNNSVPF